MQLRHLKSALVPEGDGSIGKEKVTAVAWSPNGYKLAVCTVNGMITLFDERGEEIEKFSTSTANMNPKDLIIKGLAFSPNNDKLGVAQSDSIVLVYKLGLGWGDAKSICNKFVQQTPITGLCWPVGRPNDLIFGLVDKKVRVGQLKMNSSATLYDADSYVVAVAGNPDGNGIVSSHLDGSIHRYFFGETGGNGSNHAKIVAHSCVPYALSWGKSIVAAGKDGKVIFYDIHGGVEQIFSYGIGGRCKEFTVAAFNPTGSTVVIGNFNSFYVFHHGTQSNNAWVEKDTKFVKNMFSVTALSWKMNGSQLAVGAYCGIVDIYEAYLRHVWYKDIFEFFYVSNGQVIVKKLGEVMIVLKSRFGYAITKVDIFRERFVAAHTNDTLLLVDMESMKASEVLWQSPERGKEQYLFDYPNLAIVVVAGELSIIQYGQNEILGSVCTFYVNCHVISLAMGNGGDLSTIQGSRTKSHGQYNDLQHDGFKLAYLLDLQTICIRDLDTQSLDTVNHNCKIDWLELNERGKLLLFRDKRHQLHCFNLSTLTRTTLLNYCTYVQWVPDSDVVVAQCRSNMCIWYNIYAPDQVTLHEINGDICSIERMSGRTEAIVNERIRDTSYLLDEGLIGFSAAIQDCNYTQALGILEPLYSTPESKAMWRHLGHVALVNGNIEVAQCCAIAVGDVARATYLQETLDGIERHGHRTTHLPMEDYWWIKSRLSLLNKQVKVAEDVLVSEGRVSDAIAMHVKFHDYEEALALAKRSKFTLADVEEMGHKYFKILLDSGQDERAALLKEKEGDYEHAIKLLVEKGLPAQAARILDTHAMPQKNKWRSAVVEELTKQGRHDQAGAIYEQMDQLRPALQSYVEGNAFRKAIDLAKRSFPSEVVELEECWGDYLVQRKQVDMAINHYVQAGASIKAINACFESRQFVQAAQLLEALNDPSAQRYFERLALHYEDVKQFQEAEHYFVKAGMPQLAVEMYLHNQKWDVANSLATSLMMSKDKIKAMNTEQANRMEKFGKLRDAELLYLRVDEPDAAIDMYRKHKKIDEVIRLVSVHRPDKMKEMHRLLAEQLSSEGELKNAERHYIEANEWLSAIDMYSSADMWEDAIRVAKHNGGPTSQNRVAYSWALSLGEGGTQRIQKHGLLEPAIEHAIEAGDFQNAFKLAHAGLPSKLPDIHLKHAMYLEDEEHFPEAEAEFILASKPHEAVSMYIHQKDWQAAVRVAKYHDPLLVEKVLSAQAKDIGSSGGRKLSPAIENNYVGTGQNQAARTETEHDGLKENYIHMARAHESARNWSGAIDAYLDAKYGFVKNPHDLEDLWGRAISISRTRLPTRLMEVVREVSRRLCETQRHSSAARLLMENGQLDEAVTAAISGEAWEVAIEITRDHQSLKTKGKWDELWEKAEEDGVCGAELGHFALMRLSVLLDIASLETTSQELRVTSLQGATNTQILELSTTTMSLSSNLSIYEKLTKAILGLSKEEELKLRDGALLEMLECLRKALVVLFEAGEKGSKDIEHLLMATHYSARLEECIQHGNNNKDCNDIAVRIAITLLRYIDIVPPDKAFHQAGILCRKMGEENLAFLLLNRYVDLAEAIEEKDAAIIDNSDFVHATAIPLITNELLPRTHYLLHDSDREDIREWALNVCMGGKVDKMFPKADEASGTFYAGFFASNLPTCIVTGYPVTKRDLINVNGCQAGKREWGIYIRTFSICPWKRTPERPFSGI